MSPAKGKVGSGNLYADLGLPDAEERQRKCDLAQRIVDIADAEALDEQGLAACLGLAVDEADKLLWGMVSGFSVAELRGCLERLLSRRRIAMTRAQPWSEGLGGTSPKVAVPP